MKALLVTIALVCGCGCKGQPVTPVVKDPCVAAQDNLITLQCEDEDRLLGGPNKHGVPFDQFCRDMIDQGVLTQQDALCLSKITECKQVDAECSWGE